MKPIVAVVADLCLDILFTGEVIPIYGQVEQYVDDYHIELGGSAGIFASQFTKLGGSVDLYGVIGNDFFGRFLKERLQELNISTRYVTSSKSYKTAVGLGLAKGNDRAMLTYKGSFNGVTANGIMESGILQKASHLHIASYFLLEQLQAFWLEELPILKAKGITISLDTNWSPEEDWHKVHAILPYIDVFIPNEEEALRISGKADVEQAGSWLSHFGGWVVIKQGEKGATVFNGSSGQHFTIPESLSKGLKIADTTGAGDNFDAGFLYAWLKRASLKECVNLAMRCGTGSLSAIGGIEGQIQLP
ncbi:carbohydrate kinase family protein [Rhodocytophaga rosea]|uniref:Carbohydrate kinase family protein n=1 Tax=Rhodocytophaga rosea TaxID=2704465 RepID=A0A6C0GK93_9BACT|nr:carbohydrate kinase family protein [Rhodocytophaga rosea]QHT68456.1 carbohydrate kinase family protein [Rhodocytophaga rosea]